MPELWQMSVHFLDHDAILEERVRGHGLVGVSLFLFPTFTNTVAARVIKPSHPSYPAFFKSFLAVWPTSSQQHPSRMRPCIALA